MSKNTSNRAYLLAGDLAKVYHDPPARAENGALLIGDLAIFTPEADEPTADELAAALNDINGVSPEG